MTNAVIPRPIAWVLSKNNDGSYNLAPFSYFNAVASSPPLLMISIVKKPNNGDKDTLTNIRQQKKWTIHLPSAEQIESVNQSSTPLAYGDSELTALNLKLAYFDDKKLPPRLQDAPIAFACELHQEIPLSDKQVLVLGKITSLYISDNCLATDKKGRPFIDAAALRPLCRLGAGKYSEIGQVVQPPPPALTTA